MSSLEYKRLCILCDEKMCLIRICDDCKKIYPNADMLDEPAEEDEIGIDFCDKPAEEKKAVYNDNQCMFNVMKNKDGVFKHLNLKIVGGALGLGGWFEFGGKDWSHTKYMSKPNDIHFWLEDDKGNVYDYIQPSWNLVAKIRGVYDKFPNIELRGVSKKKIKRKYKIEYVATKEHIYRDCFSAITRGCSIDD